MHGLQKATAAGAIDTLWDMNDLKNGAMDRAERKRKAARIERMVARLRREERT